MDKTLHRLIMNRFQYSFVPHSVCIIQLTFFFKLKCTRERNAFKEGKQTIQPSKMFMDNKQISQRIPCVLLLILSVTRLFGDNLL